MLWSLKHRCFRREPESAIRLRCVIHPEDLSDDSRALFTSTIIASRGRCRPYRGSNSYLAYPGLSAWANSIRASGARGWFYRVALATSAGKKWAHSPLFKEFASKKTGFETR